MKNMDNKLTFRFDDICVNSDMNHANDIAFFLKTKFPDCRIIYGISPLVTDMSKYPNDDNQRVFPKVFTALSDYRNFYFVQKLGIPDVPEYVEVASHGMIHVDHRLLTLECQEMSILLSCNLVNSQIFIPPFNKWNNNTDMICNKMGIELIKFEKGWLSMEHNSYNPNHTLWYLHHRAFTLEQIKSWF